MTPLRSQQPVRSGPAFLVAHGQASSGLARYKPANDRFCTWPDMPASDRRRLVNRQFLPVSKQVALISPIKGGHND
jgi:hypothetical protein